MTKRLFLAVDVDAATRGEIERISSDLRRRIDQHVKMSWVQPDRMHLTLQFFGQADEAMEGRIRAALAEPIPEQSFDLSFAGLGCFPPSGAPRVLWLGVRDGLNELRNVHDVTSHRLARTVGQQSGRGREKSDPFAPHLTLGRFRPATDRRQRVSRSQLKQIAGIPASAGPSRFDRVTLYESRLSPSGPTYFRLAEVLLT